MSVPNIAVLRERAATIIARASSGQMRAMLAGICAAKNTGDPLPADSTGQELITQCQGIIDQAESDALAIFVRELMEFVENASTGGDMGCCDQVAEILSILQGSGTGAPVFAGSNPGSGTELSYYGEQIVVAGLRPIDYTLESGSIPTGTTLNGSTGLISGASPTAGTYTFTIRATNTLGSATQEFTIYIAGLAPSLVYPVPGAYGLDPVISDNLILFFEGTDVMQQYSAYAARPGWTGTVATFAPIGSYTGGYLGTQPITYSVSGSLPDGITIDALTGALVGIPTLASASYYQLVFRASNAYGSISARYTFQVISLP